MKPIFLIGYMGSGKSTMGRLVSRIAGIDSIDLDKYIENRFRKTISEIFTEHGEQRFREIEREMLREVAEMEDVIIACGGGTPCFFDNMEIINSSGISVWLDAPVSILHSRLLRGQYKRPLIAGMSPEELRDFISKGLEARKKHYSKAHYKFSTSLLESEQDRQQTADRFIEKFCR